METIKQFEGDLPVPEMDALIAEEEARVLNANYHLHRQMTYARQLFLFGDGNGEPITSPKRLAEITGMTPAQITHNSRKWIVERERMLKKTTNLETCMATEIANMQHQNDMQFLRSKVDELRHDIEGLDNTREQMEELTRLVVEAVREGGGDVEQLLKIFQTYLKTLASRKSLMELWIKYKSLWDAKIGIDAQQNVSVDVVKFHKKQMLKRNITEEDGVEKMRPVGPDRNIFRR
jgi:hypothetical protein